MDFHNFVGLLCDQNFVTGAATTAKGQIRAFVQCIYVVINGPTTGAHLEQIASYWAEEFAVCEDFKITESPIRIDEVGLVREVSSDDTSKRAAIDSDLSSEAQLLSHVPEYLLPIFPDVSRIGHPFAQPIPSVVPYHDINTLVQEESEIVSMRLVNHVLIEHRIRIA